MCTSSRPRQTSPYKFTLASYSCWNQLQDRDARPQSRINHQPSYPVDLIKNYRPAKTIRFSSRNCLWRVQQVAVVFITLLSRRGITYQKFYRRLSRHFKKHLFELSFCIWSNSFPRPRIAGYIWRITSLIYLLTVHACVNILLHPLITNCLLDCSQRLIMTTWLLTSTDACHMKSVLPFITNNFIIDLTN